MSAERTLAAGSRTGGPDLSSGGDEGGGVHPSTPLDPTILLPDEDVGHFRVRRELGAGGMGRVYLARDLVLGRLVALKVMRADRVAPSRLIEEARTTARFNHPHVVTVYGSGTHRGMPYLALEYLDGESLRERMASGRLSVDEALRIARAVADALAHAHARGVRHCDLKPGNVMLAKDGRPRVVDFGLAGHAGISSGKIAGTPGYMAPEQWLLENLTDRVDVWAFGVMLHEMLEGLHPFPEHTSAHEMQRAVLDPRRAPSKLSREAVPPDVSRLIERCLLRDPAERPPASELVEALDRALAPGRGLGGAESPFRGLQAFEERHAQVFFGREAEVGALVERLRAETVLPVVGPSGAGKSSFVHAGVAPRLLARERWTIVSMRPGASPLKALAARLLGAGGPPSKGSIDPAFGESVASLAAQLRATPEVSALRLGGIAAATGGKVLLVVDQLEELFTHVTDEGERERFLDAVLRAADDAAEPVRVILTVRDDFVGRIPALRSLFVLQPLGRDALRRTIEGPLEQVGYRFEDPAIVGEMLAELKGGHGELPLLQFACRWMWDARDEGRRLLLRSAYERAGGVAGALAEHADAVLVGLAEEELRAAKQALLRLVNADGTKRVVPEDEAIAGLGAAGERAVARLTDARLLVRRRSRENAAPLLELPHESLIVRWTRLSRWLEEGREEKVLLEELSEAAALWEKRGRRREETWSGDALRTALARARSLGVALPPAVEAFLGAGVEREQAGLRRRRWLYGAAIGVLGATTAGALMVASELRVREQEAKRQAHELRLANANLGELDLVLAPFDWDPVALRARAPASAAPLSVSVYAAADDYTPGRKRSATVEARTSTESGVQAFFVSAPGGRAFLEIARGPCPPSWVRAAAFPGYGEARRRWRVSVPTCAATRAGMVAVPAGEFVYGGPGDPPVRKPKDAETEVVRALPAFAIDATEVSNAAYAVYSALAPITGDPAPRYLHERHPELAAPDHPVTAVNALSAEAFCRYMGKRLPIFAEWSKAARGGLSLADGRPNPYPRRRYPWGPEEGLRRANLAGAADGCASTCSVLALRRNESPYGARDLIGNVAEWGTGWDHPHESGHWPTFGGSWFQPLEPELHTTAFANQRDRFMIDYDTGLRCVLDAGEGGREP